MTGTGTDACACAHAWLNFLQRQPDRDGDPWKGWLYVTAKREAWKLNALELKEREDLPASGAPDIVEPVDPRDRLSERVEFQAALQELKNLPPLLQEVVVVRSQVWKQADVAEAMGLSRQRVAELLVNAALGVSQLNEGAPPGRASGGLVPSGALGDSWLRLKRRADRDLAGRIFPLRGDKGLQ